MPTDEGYPHRWWEDNDGDKRDNGRKGEGCLTFTALRALPIAVALGFLLTAASCDDPTGFNEKYCEENPTAESCNFEE